MDFSFDFYDYRAAFSDYPVHGLNQPTFDNQFMNPMDFKAHGVRMPLPGYSQKELAAWYCHESEKFIYRHSVTVRDNYVRISVTTDVNPTYVAKLEAENARYYNDYFLASNIQSSYPSYISSTFGPLKGFGS